MTEQASSNTAPTATVTTDTTKDTPVTAAPPPVPPAKPVDEPESAQNAPNQSLEKLLSHIESLQQSNAELEKAIQVVRDGNIQKLKQSMSDKIMPWIEKLDISPEYKQSFLQGIEAACCKAPNSTVSDFETNPVYQVVCSAAAAHGNAINELEMTRKELQDSKAELSGNKLETDKYIQSRADALLYSNPGKKRTNEQISQETSSEGMSGLWADMFSVMHKNNY